MPDQQLEPLTEQRIRQIVREELQETVREFREFIDGLQKLGEFLGEPNFPPSRVTRRQPTREQGIHHFGESGH